MSYITEEFILKIIKDLDTYTSIVNELTKEVGYNSGFLQGLRANIVSVEHTAEHNEKGIEIIFERLEKLEKIVNQLKEKTNDVAEKNT